MKVNCGGREREREGEVAHAIGTAARVFKPGKNNLRTHLQVAGTTL